MSIGPLDTAIVAVYLLGMVALGVWLGRGQHTAKDYLLGGRDLPWPALLISIVATETSTVTFLSVPGLVHGDGVAGSPGDMRFLQLPLGFLLGRVIAARLLLPLYFRGELFTAYEVLQARFGPLLRGLASTIFLVMRTLADGLRLYLTAVVLQELAGVSLPVAVLVTGTSTLVYTFFGGVRAVVWTDVLQFAIYMLGALFAVWSLGAATGVLDRLPLTGEVDSHLRVFSFAFTLADGHTLWAGLIGGAFLSLGTHGVDQLVVQRYLCARSLRDAQKALVASGVVVLLQFALFLLLGLLLWLFYRQHPPAQPFGKGDAVFVDYLVHHMPSGVRGLVLGAVFAAAMSTLSGSLNSSASALVNDILLPLQRRTTSDARTFRQARMATLLFGGLQMAVGASGLGGGSVVDQVLTIASFTTGILLGVFFLALLPGPTAPAAAIAGLLGGACLTGGLYVARDSLPEHLRIAGLWFGTVGALSTFACGAVARTWWRPARP
ncbi:MAG: sodium:solute symporter [Planctomycetes bacterium]|nr:sodium:solute symporter [Planctomycetota bacterium]